MLQKKTPTLRRKAPVLLGILAAAMVLTACGSGSTNSGSPATTSSAAGSSESSAAPGSTSAAASATSAATSQAATSATATSSGGAISGTLADIKKKGVITVGMAVDPPFVMRRPDGTWYSFNADLLALLGKDLGVKVEYVPAGFATIVAGLQAGQFDIIGTSISATTERKKAIAFTDPYAYGGNSWIVPASEPYRTVESLNDPKVTIAASNNTFQSEITTTMMPKAKLRAIPNASYADLISELTSGQSNAISVPSFLAPAIIKKFPNLVAVPPGAQGVSSTPVAWGVRKDDTDLLAALNSFIAEQTKNGTIQKLYDQWITLDNALG